MVWPIRQRSGARGVIRVDRSPLVVVLGVIAPAVVLAGVSAVVRMPVAVVGSARRVVVVPLAVSGVAVGRVLVRRLPVVGRLLGARRLRGVPRLPVTLRVAVVVGRWLRLRAVGGRMVALRPTVAVLPLGLVRRVGPVLVALVLLVVVARLVPVAAAGGRRRILRGSRAGLAGVGGRWLL